MSCAARSAAGTADRAWSRALGGASMELLWTLAARSPAVVIEANFRPYSAYERERLTSLGGRPSRCTARARPRSPPPGTTPASPIRCT